MSRGYIALVLVALVSALLSSPCAAQEEMEVDIAYVVVDVANVRTGPGTGHSVAFQVEFGDPLIVSSEGAEWMRVQPVGTQDVGWIFKKLVSRERPSTAGEGTYGDHHYTYRKTEGKYFVLFDPVLPRDDATVIGAMLELINTAYGKHLLVGLTPKLVERDGKNVIRFEGKKHYYLFLLFKEDTGEVSSFRMWRESR